MTGTITERVGRYQLLEPIGVGPSGSVSRAKVFGVAGFERQFAIKRFHTELTTVGSLAQALSAAARAYGGLEHPRIARMSEFGVAQGMTFTAVEYVAGLDALRLIAEARLANSTLAAGGALTLVSQAARAVGYAHGRGLTHLGLSPTNVIVTGDGDVKLTDFGILAAMLPARPVDVARLAHRIQYLAPEQLANEATSAATDVFALGVLAYELVTGNRTFKGDSPHQVAQSVMSGPPAEPPLPRPIVRVLQRCLARSPFERFPDARALADALDAALRVAPVPGTRKDIGAQVTQTLERIVGLNFEDQSGIVALDLGAIPRRPILPLAPIPRTARDSQDAVETSEFVRPDSAPGQELAVAPKPPATVVGLAPPPIPQRATTPRTIVVGGDAARPLVGAVPPPIPMPLPFLRAQSPVLAKPVVAHEPEDEHTIPEPPPIPWASSAPVIPLAQPEPDPEPDPDPQTRANEAAEPPVEYVPLRSASEPSGEQVPLGYSQPLELDNTDPPRRSRLRWIVVAAAGAAAFGATILAFRVLDDRNPITPTIVAEPERRTEAATTGPAMDADDSSSPNAAQLDAAVAVVAIDTAPAVPVDALAADAAPARVEPAGLQASASLAITSTPPGARVFLDGVDAGATPFKRPGDLEGHALALVLAGHELYVAKVDGRGAFAIPLTKVTPSGGPAGIKVIKCKDKDRYYVFVDAKPTGQTCPTERIEAALGHHVVEAYDLLSASRRSWEIDIKDTRLSFRVRIDP